MRCVYRFCVVGFVLVVVGLFGGCPMELFLFLFLDFILLIDYVDIYMEVCGCWQSGDHDLYVIRVFVDFDVFGFYENCMDFFLVGFVVVKEEYDFGDVDCSGEVVRWTVMQCFEDGSALLDLDWYWQGIDADFVVDEDNSARCVQCYQGCGDFLVGYLGTCIES